MRLHEHCSNALEADEGQVCDDCASELDDERESELGVDSYEALDEQRAKRIVHCPRCHNFDIALPGTRCDGVKATNSMIVRCQGTYVPGMFKTGGGA